MALAKLGKNAEAIKEFQLAVKLAPNEAIPHVLLGQWLELLGHKSGAMDEYRRTLMLDPSDAIARSKLGISSGLNS